MSDYWKKENIKGEMKEIQTKAKDEGGFEKHTEIWSSIKRDIKPVFNEWFIDWFPNPEVQFDARMKFIRSTAAWSMVGYIMGLGDWHGDNILLHLTSGDISHVDFDCIFEKGKKLKVPEKVPFRLTKNIIDAFGIFKEKGTFVTSCEVILKVIRRNSKNIEGYL